MRKSNIIASVAFVIFALVVIGYTQSTFPAGRHGVPGPGIFPILVSIIMVLAGLVIILHYIRNKENTPIAWLEDGTKRAYMAIGVMTAYVILAPIVGFFTTTFAFLILTVKWFSKKGWIYTLVVSALVVAFIYVSFSVVLRVPLQFGFII